MSVSFIAHVQDKGHVSSAMLIVVIDLILSYFSHTLTHIINLNDIANGDIRVVMYL